MFTQRITEIDLDLTNLCNVRCPQCQRYDINYRLRPGLNKNHITLDLIKKQIDLKYLKMVNRYYHIGTTGEPTMNPEFLDIQKFLIDVSPQAGITCHTNGSTRDTDFWANCGKVYSTSTNNVIQFALDGLADTHHLYRVGSDYETVLKNARTFIDNGGTAVWQFIIFKHNQHQVHEASALAKKYGFAKFKSKRSSRFIHSNDSQPHKLPYKLEPATQVGNQKVPSKVITGLDAKVRVDCESIRDNFIAIYPDGTVWPCTWLSGIHLWNNDPHNAISWSMIKKHIIKPYGPLPNINTQKLSDILASEQWNAWQFVNKRPTIICIQHCNMNQPTTEDLSFGPNFGHDVAH